MTLIVPSVIIHYRKLTVISSIHGVSIPLWSFVHLLNTNVQCAIVTYVISQL